MAELLAAQWQGSARVIPSRSGSYWERRLASHFVLRWCKELHKCLCSAAVTPNKRKNQPAEVLDNVSWPPKMQGDPETVHSSGDVRRQARLHASSYLQLGARQPSMIAEQFAMLECYLQDVRRLGALTEPAPAHVAAAEQGGSPVAVRLVTWNINMLMGADGKTRIEPHDAAALLASFNADVLALQESPVARLDELWSGWFTEPMCRVRELDVLLKGMGYELLRSPADNPTLLATRLPVLRTQDGPVLDAAPVQTLNGGALWSEVRAARFAELALPGPPGFGEGDARDAAPQGTLCFAQRTD
mmetsp:Transcript_20689/g.57175  ORF Transcript_20689/g.57175 Transcript_20689/m.57175 type:complete len:302 (-) Transcript_20689:81-986(-)